MRTIHLFIVAATIFFLRPGFCQSPEQFARNAAAFTASGGAPTTTVRPSFSGDSWVKIVVRITHATWDVKKTDSMLDPVVGTVTLSLESGVSDRKATQDDASRASLVSSDFESERLELQYVPSATGWVFSKGTRFSKVLGAAREIKLPPQNSPFIPYVWAAQGYAVSAPK